MNDERRCRAKSRAELPGRTRGGHVQEQEGGRALASRRRSFFGSSQRVIDQQHHGGEGPDHVERGGPLQDLAEDLSRGAWIRLHGTIARNASGSANLRYGMTPPVRLLLVDDEPDLQQPLVLDLGRSGRSAREAHQLGAVAVGERLATV